MSKVEVKIARSKQRFLNVVWPEIGHWFGGGEIEPVESVNSTVAQTLDQEGGVDFFNVVDDSGIITLASRVQTGPNYHRSHTIRYDTGTGHDTEMQKRIRQIERGLVTPLFTIQAYVTLKDEVTGRLDNVAAVKTEPLYQYILETDQCQSWGRDPYEIEEGWYIQENGYDGNLFAVVPWHLLAGYTDMCIYRAHGVDKATVNESNWWRRATGDYNE